jgi:signal transduction histidine kinase
MQSLLRKNNHLLKNFTSKISEKHTSGLYRDMISCDSLKKKLIFCNILMIGIPLFITIFISMGAMYFFYRSYLDPVENLFQDKNELVYAQSLLYTSQDKLSNIDPSNRNSLQKNLQSLGRSMEDLGYHMRYTINMAPQYDTITEEDIRVARYLLGNRLHTGQHLTASRAGRSIIKLTWNSSHSVITILAVNSGQQRPHAMISLKHYFIAFMVVLFLLVFGSIAMVNTWLYRKVHKDLLVPMVQLSLATKAIREGDLSATVDYHNTDELGMVCDNFRAMQQYLRNSVEERVRNEENRRELFSGISHDLRTPLTSIRGYTEALLAGIASSPEKQKRYLNAIASRSKDLERLINDLSLYNRLAAHQLICHPEKVNFGSVVRQYAEEEMEYLSSKNMTVHFDIDDTLDVMLDEKEFRRVLFNLFTNTIKYREKDTSQVSVSIHKEGEEAVFSYHDDGPGVVPEKLPHIFEAFYRADASRTKTSEGSGLGLAVVAEIANAHNGRVEARNENGLTIRFCIPLPKGGSQ